MGRIKNSINELTRSSVWKSVFRHKLPKDDKNRALAILTAYVREVGRGCGLAADFSGPMAKPHRMALVTAAALASLFEPLWNGRNEILLAALWLVALGSGVTALRRAWRIVRALRGA